MSRHLQLLALVFSILFSASFTALALPVTLQSQWEYQLHPSSLNVSGLGVFTFTYEDTTPVFSVSGTPQYPRGLYVNAITAASFELGALTLTLDQSADNKVSINALNGAGTDAIIYLSFLDASNASYKLQMGFEDYAHTFTNIALSNLIGLDNDDNPQTWITPPGCANPFICGYTFIQKTPLEAVPTPAAVWLFGSGLLGLAGFKRRSIAPRR